MFIIGSISFKMTTNQLIMIPSLIHLKIHENCEYKIRNLVRSDRRLTIRGMVDELNLSFFAVYSILTEDLNMLRVISSFPRTV